MDTVQSCGMEEITGQLMWSTASKVSLSKEGDAVYMVRLKEVLYYELLLESQMINFNKDCSQLDQLRAALSEKHPELVNKKCIIFHQDNARPHASLMSRQKLLGLSWEVLIHQPYSPDIAPLDFYLFWSLQNHFNGKNFNSLYDCKCT